MERTRAIDQAGRVTRNLGRVLIIDQCSLSPGDNGQQRTCYSAIGERPRRMPMPRGSKVFRPTYLPESNSSSYPAPFRDSQRKRWNRRLGDHGGLKNYGVNFVRVEP